MATGFAKMMEDDAVGFINKLTCDEVLDRGLYSGNRNFKPWYSPRGLIDNAVGGVDRVLIGVNPGGTPGDPDRTTVDRRWEREMNPNKPFNAFLDESWEGCPEGESPLQIGVRNVFEALYVEQWEVTLRNTACFNVCPARSRNSRRIHRLLWDESVKWFGRVINDLKPTTMICNGNGLWRSPWSVLRVVQLWSEPLTETAYLKFGTATLSDGHVAFVIGIPHLTGALDEEADRDRLYGLISANRGRLIGHEKD